MKLSAAWLIERAGIARGFALPGLGRGDLVQAHARDREPRRGDRRRRSSQLAGYVQTRVQSEFGVRLQPEPVLVGVRALTFNFDQ